MFHLPILHTLYGLVAWFQVARGLSYSGVCVVKISGAFLSSVIQFPTSSPLTRDSSYYSSMEFVEQLGILPLWRGQKLDACAPAQDSAIKRGKICCQDGPLLPSSAPPQAWNPIPSFAMEMWLTYFAKLRKVWLPGGGEAFSLQQQPEKEAQGKETWPPGFLLWRVLLKFAISIPGFQWTVGKDKEGSQNFTSADISALGWCQH